MGDDSTSALVRGAVVFVILFNLFATVFYVKKARAAQPPRPISDTILQFVAVVIITSPFLVMTRRVVILVLLLAFCFVIAIVNLWRAGRLNS